MGDYKIFFQNHLKGLASRLMTHPRRWYHKKKAKNCKKEKCSIICNNCTGGVILHDLGLRFDTPTINTFFIMLMISFSLCQILRLFQKAICIKYQIQIIPILSVPLN